MKNSVVFGILAVMVAVGLGVFLWQRPGPEAVPAPTESGTYTEQTDTYEIETHYATTTPLIAVSASADATAAVAMRRFVEDTVAEFKTFDASDQKLMLQIVYLIASGERTISYIYTVNQYSGGAHGTTYFRTFTFDTVTGAELVLADFFLPGSEYLARLSAESRAKLPAIIGDATDAQTVAAGTTAAAGNFANFFIGGATMGILFPPYQVAAYAAGPQTLPVPLADLADILKPEYRP